MIRQVITCCSADLGHLEQSTEDTEGCRGLNASGYRRARGRL
jgi:hypothetical protein